ncbi:MAG: prolipoprotein diacylglyceryl transferase [Sporomusa sp.]|jgi:phosphatidylglycerol:prolipoprotein diacylglycerol transferase|nr:prolipoprotein diacylglyceryl transferase [Sporomusa sp.]
MGKTAFLIGTIAFSWFGLILAGAILSACIINWWHVRLRNEDYDRLLDLTLYSIPVGIITARIYYVIVNWQLYVTDPSEVLRIWHGGLAIHGALIGVILTIWVYSRVQLVSFWRWADIVAPGIIFGQAIGQWGNFVNQDTFGYPTDAPWGIYIDYACRPSGYEQFDFFHPTSLYESCWGVSVFIFLIAVSWLTTRKYVKLAPGNLFLLYIILYSAGRLLIEGLRLDSEMIGEWRLAQLVSGFAIICAGVLMWRNRIIKKRLTAEGVGRRGGGSH